MTVDALLSAFGDRAYGLLMLLFALPNLIPIPLIPGSTTVTGVPLILLAAQMALRMERPWLPAWIRRWSLQREVAAELLLRVSPWLRRFEAALKPRWPAMVSSAGLPIVGVVCLVMAVVLTLPVPFGNFVPALSLALVALGLIERDGRAVAAGMLVAGVAIGLLIAAGVAVKTAAARAVWHRPGVIR